MVIDPSPDTAPPPDAILRMLLEASAVRFGEFTLTSGEKSDVYVDVKRAWTDPHRLDLLARAFAARVGRRTASRAWSWARSPSWWRPPCAPDIRSRSCASP